MVWKRLKPGRPGPSSDSSTAGSSLSSTSHHHHASDWPAGEDNTEAESTPTTTSNLAERPRHQSLPGTARQSTSLSLSPPFLSSRRQSALSDVYEQLRPSPHQRHRSRDRKEDPLGLFVLHTPEGERSIDVVFIHGLGGTSLRTWCHDRNLDNLWPQRWLPYDLPTARVLTFGYNTHFSSKKEQTSSTIGDFATDLLFRMKYGENTPERLGQVPIVVVAHSMGGLVFKKAFIQGHLNNEFNNIISMIKAVLFLATPHRGTDLAETLNKFLWGSLVYTPREYIAELARRSPTIDELNDAFRHHASKLQIFSFYETMATQMGPTSVMLLDKTTSVMGYHNETTTPLTADHHTVCKFSSQKDPNYVAVLGALRSIADAAESPVEGPATSKEDVQSMSELLGVLGPPEEDFAAARGARKLGTCESFLSSSEFGEWVDSTTQRILWAHAPPGNGKSTICSAVIELLQEADRPCSYFFFKYGQSKTQSTSSMLRSLAFQTALHLPAYRQALLDLASSGVRLSKADSTTVWKALFVSALARISTAEPVYWVIDGLDESASSKHVVEMLSGVADFDTPIRLLFLSRPLASISHLFQLARKKIAVTEMPLPDNREDIRLLVAEEIDYLLSGDDFKAEAVSEIAARSQGNFLWASLVTKAVVKCHREEQVKRVLESTPDGMDQLYNRMMDTVASLEMDEDKHLAQILLTWAMYATAPVTVEEFSEIYPTELKSIMDFGHTVTQVCGQFVEVNSQGRITLVHHSAREYLKRTRQFPFSLALERASEELLAKCLVALCDKGLRRKINTLKMPQFLPYAAVSWASHLEDVSADSDRVLDGLVKFFNGPYPLAWIQYLAMSGRLSELFGASRKLGAYVRRRRKGDPERSPLLHRLTDVALLDTWAVDLTKLPTKFGRYLSEDPALIYKCIPTLSPESSIVRQKFSENPSALLTVSGLPNPEWDDCLARVSGGEGRAVRLAVSPLYLAVVGDLPKGTIAVWDTSLFEEQRSFNVEEHIWAVEFNASGSLLACFSYSNTHIWRTADWSSEACVPNPEGERAVEFRFDESNCLVMVSDLRKAYRLRTRRPEPASWEPLSPRLFEEPVVPEGMFLGTPSSVSFNNDCTQVAIAYRSFPLSIWSVEPPEMVARLRRTRQPGLRSVHSHTGDNKVVWHPSGATVVGIFGQIFKWNPVEDSYEEAKDDPGVLPNGIAVSPNGQVFLTTDAAGCIKIYDFSSMSLMYKLTSEDRINQIRFGHDNVRFYDLRGSYCNIWEPNCLLRLADAVSEQISDADSTSDSFWSDTEDTHSTSISFPAFEMHADTRPPVVALEPGRNPHEPVAQATKDGTVSIYDTLSKRRHEVGKTMFKMRVEALAWTPRKHDRLAYSLSNGATTVKSISIGHSADRPVSMDTVYGEKKSAADRGRTLQLLFDSAGERLLVYGLRKCQVLSLPDGTVLAEHAIAEDDPARWQQHPSSTEDLICVQARSISVFGWDDLKQKSSFVLDLSHPDVEETSETTSSARIDAILDSHFPQLLLLRIVSLHLNRTRYEFLAVPTAEIYGPVKPAVTESAAPSPAAIKPVHMSRGLASTILHAPGILPDGRLVFLDRRLWVCTVALSASSRESDVVKHFFLPHDWVTAQDLRLSRLLRDGTLLCPSKGEVAVLRANLVRDW